MQEKSKHKVLGFSASFLDRCGYASRLRTIEVQLVPSIADGSYQPVVYLDGIPSVDLQDVYVWDYYPTVVYPEGDDVET